MYPFAIAAIAAGAAAWLLFSLSPGSYLGFAFTSGDWAQLLRDLKNGERQTRATLRAAGHRSLASHFVLIGLCLGAELASGNYSPSVVLFFLAALSGLALGYLVLLWVTRPGGWYGVA